MTLMIHYGGEMLGLDLQWEVKEKFSQKSDQAFLLLDDDFEEQFVSAPINIESFSDLFSMMNSVR